jgi:hypothetical protein
MAEDELPPGYEKMEENGKKYILTPLLDSEGNETRRIKISSLRDLTVQHGKLTPRHPNGRFLGLLPNHVKAWCYKESTARQSRKVVQVREPDLGDIEVGAVDKAE